MTPVWYAAKVNSQRRWLAWLLLCLLAFTAPAQAMNGLRLPMSAFSPGPKTACTAKPSTGDFPINKVDPSGNDPILLSPFSTWGGNPGEINGTPVRTFTHQSFFSGLYSTELVYTYSHSYSRPIHRPDAPVQGYNLVDWEYSIGEKDVLSIASIREYVSQNGSPTAPIIYSSGCKLGSSSNLYNALCSVDSRWGDTHALIVWRQQVNIKNQPLKEFDQTLLNYLCSGETAYDSVDMAIKNFRSSGNQDWRDFADYADRNLLIYGNGRSQAIYGK